MWRQYKPEISRDIVCALKWLNMLVSFYFLSCELIGLYTVDLIVLVSDYKW